MIPKKYQRKNETWWKGRLVRTTEQIGNAYHTVPKNTLCFVTHKYGGLDVQSFRCSLCGIAAKIRGVQYSSLELLEIIDLSTGETDSGKVWQGNYFNTPQELSEHLEGESRRNEQ